MSANLNFNNVSTRYFNRWCQE